MISSSRKRKDLVFLILMAALTAAVLVAGCVKKKVEIGMCYAGKMEGMVVE